MLPAFEIYFCILSDAWMPWLEENQNDSRFEPLILADGIPLRDASPRFFKAVYPVFKKYLNVCPEKVLSEIQYLGSVDRSKAGNRLTSRYMQLPALSARGVFYNVITGQALGGYYDWCSRILNESVGDLPDYYLPVIIDRVKHQLSIPGPEFKISEADRVHVLNVQVALLALFHLLREKYEEHVSGLHAFYNPEDWLEANLHTVDLSQKAKDGALHLYCNLTEPPATKVEPVPGIDNKPENKIEKALKPQVQQNELPPLIYDLQNEFGSMTEAIKQLAGEKNQNYTGYYSSAEVRELLNISKSTLKRYRDSNILEYKQIGNKMLYPKNQKAFLNEGNN